MHVVSFEVARHGLQRFLVALNDKFKILQQKVSAKTTNQIIKQAID